MPQLDPTWFASQIFWLAVTFLILYAALSRLVLPSLQEVLSRRQETLHSDIELAQSLKHQSEQARQHYERTLSEARLRVQQLMDEAVLASKGQAEKSTKALDMRIAIKLQEAEQKIGALKKQLMDALYPSTNELASMIVEKLTQEKPSNDQVKRALDALAKQG